MNKIKIIIGSAILSIPIIYKCYKYNDTKYTHINLNTILKNDCSSQTKLCVSKKVSTHWDKNNINVYENEKKWLQKLTNTDIIAKPIYFIDNDRTIITEYSGEKINKHNIPDNWEQQRDNIISVLKQNNCRHNDIKPDEILVQNNKIKLIDFGWAHDANNENPENWPAGLGSTFKCNINEDMAGNKLLTNQGFDDKCSFTKSLLYVINNNS